MSKPSYVYVASSWRNPMHDQVCSMLKALEVEHYDFKNPPGRAGFGWEQITGSAKSHKDLAAGKRHTESIQSYLIMLNHPLAEAGFNADFDALKRADAVVLVLPCGKSAHLELGYAVGKGKRTAILLEEPMEPDLMYLMVDYLARTPRHLLDWLGI